MSAGQWRGPSPGEVKRLTQGFLRATGLSPDDIRTTYNFDDRTVTVQAKASDSVALRARDASVVAMERIEKLKAGAASGD